MAGPIFSLYVGGGRKEAHGLLNALKLIDISNNIGDSRSLMTHPASTTHYGMAEAARLEIAITEDRPRISVRLKPPQDVIVVLATDFTRVVRAVVMWERRR